MIELYGVAIVIALIVVSYLAGLKTANWYNDKAAAEQKHALEVQYVRLRTGSDFNDPVGPYIASPACAGRTIRKGFTPAQLKEVEARLKNTGSATVKLDQTAIND